MKVLKVLSVAFLALVVASCGKKSEGSSVAPESSDSSYEESSMTTGSESESSDMESTESSSSTTTSSSSEDWDEVLDSYEEYVDSYIELAKKAKDGDPSALAEYSDLLQKAQSLSDKLSNSESEMSSSQLNRYMEITTKFSSAAMP